MANTWSRMKPLVEAHINGLSVGIIEDHREFFRTFIGHQRSGIYVLRKSREIYYVGLASSLRSRLSDHLKDHHKRKWDEFDLYIIRKDKVKYLKELETLLIRVAKPSGNRTEPKFVKHKNVTKNFKRGLIEQASKKISKLFLG